MIRHTIRCSQCEETFPGGYEYRMHWEIHLDEFLTNKKIMKNMNINIANKSLAKANAAYLNRLSEFRSAFRSRHEISLMDDNIPKYSLYAAMDLLIEVRMARYASESVTDRHISEHNG